MRIEALCTGDELLTGVTTDTNSTWFQQRLLEHGLQVNRTTVVGDVREEILEALQTLSARADVVLVSGGLGPTTDDLTAEVAARAAGVPLVVHEGELAALLRARGPARVPGAGGDRGAAPHRRAAGREGGDRVPRAPSAEDGVPRRVAPRRAGAPPARAPPAGDLRVPDPVSGEPPQAHGRGSVAGRGPGGARGRGCCGPAPPGRSPLRCGRRHHGLGGGTAAGGPAGDTRAGRELHRGSNRKHAD